jgi:alkaline phosphatase
MSKLKFMLVLAALCLPGSTLAQSQPMGPLNRSAKQVIFMIPDGMGLANVTATRIRLNGPAGAPLNLETLDRVGYMRTYSETNTVTDSSAAASAFACGEKFVNNEVCFHADGRPNNPTLLELAKSRGMATGMVATQTITHATPASFGAHVAARKCENEIARQYVMDSRPDVLLGGGRATFTDSVIDCPPSGDYITAASRQGYTYVTTKDGMRQAAAGSTDRILGLFADKNLTPEYQRKPGTTEPRLPEMTAAALTVLERNKTGFFLMVEGSLIDSADHAESSEYQFGEMSAFDESVKVVLDWINARPERKEETLLIIVPDHETGGFAILGSETPNAGLGPFTYGWTFTLIPGDPKDFEAHHTGGDLVLWSQGPGSDELARPIDNTGVYEVAKRALRF